MRARIDITDPDRRWSVEFGPDQAPGEGLPILGMRADRPHELRVSLLPHSGGEVAVPEPLRYRTPPLPRGFDFPHGIRINRDDRSHREPGVLLLSVHRIPRGRYHEWSQEKVGLRFLVGDHRRIGRRQ